MSNLLSGDTARLVGGSKVQLPDTPAPVEGQWIIASPPGTDQTEWIDGSSGPPGPMGPPGPQGEGINITGTADTAANLPPTYTGDIGDVYTTLDDGHGHSWQGSSWLDIGSLQGPQGIQGPEGPEGPVGPTGASGVGSVWFSGSGAPVEGLGDIQDFYLNADTDEWYEKTDETTWVLRGDFTGAQGDPGEDGAGSPPGGTTGQILAKTTDADHDVDWIDPTSSDWDDITNKPTEFPPETHTHSEYDGLEASKVSKAGDSMQGNLEMDTNTQIHFAGSWRVWHNSSDGTLNITLI